jgi:protein-tyrosine phosphatase
MCAVYRSQALSLSPADLAVVNTLRITADYDLRTTCGLLTDIANSNGAVLYHCSASKDRTGWATAVLLTLLGVPRDTVTQDYLLSNTYYFDSPAVQAELKAMPAAESAVYAPLLEVQASYLQAGFAQVAASCGSTYGYAVHGLGLSPQMIAKLRHKLLVG